MPRKLLNIVYENKVIVLLFLICVFLRFFNLEKFTTFLSDQGRDAIIVYRIATFKNFPLIGAPTSVGQVFLGPFFYYLIAPFLPLFRFNPIGLVAAVATYSVIGIFISYLFVKKAIDKITAFFFLLLVIFSATQIDFARFSWNPNLLPITSFLMFYFLYMTSVKKGKLYPLLFGAFLSFSIQLHYLAIFLLPTVALVMSADFFRTKQKFQVIQKILYAGIAFIFFSSPLILFDLRHQFINSKNFIKLFSHGDLVTQSSYWSRLLETNQAFINQVFQTNLTQQVAFLLTALIILSFGYLFSKNKISPLVTINTLAFAVYIFLFSLLTSARHPHYYTSIHYSFFLLMAFLLTTAWRLKIGRYVAIALIALYLVLNIKTYQFLKPQKDDWNQITHSQRVGNFLADKTEGKPFNVATWPIDFGEENYLYFTELRGMVPADRAKVEITDQMFVLCNKQPCQVIDSPSWNISMFGKAKIDKMWNIDGVTIYRLVHEK